MEKPFSPENGLLAKLKALESRMSAPDTDVTPQNNNISPNHNDTNHPDEVDHERINDDLSKTVDSSCESNLSNSVAQSEEKTPAEVNVNTKTNETTLKPQEDTSDSLISVTEQVDSLTGSENRLSQEADEVNSYTAKEQSDSSSIPADTIDNSLSNDVTSKSNLKPESVKTLPEVNSSQDALMDVDESSSNEVPNEQETSAAEKVVDVDTDSVTVEDKRKISQEQVPSPVTESPNETENHSLEESEAASFSSQIQTAESGESLSEKDHENTDNVVHVDDTEEDDEMLVKTNDKDPIGQDSEVTIAEGDAISTGKEGEDTEDMEVDQDLEESLKSEDTGSKETGSEESQETSKTSISQKEKPAASSDGPVEIENCIIPDSVNDDETVNKCDSDKAVTKPPRKFDITPVRLETLMDPSKLINVTTRTSESPDTADENKNIMNSTSAGRPRRVAARIAENQIKEIVAGGGRDMDAESAEKSSVCCRCARLRICKWVGPSLMTYACVESCYKLIMEKKSAAATLPTVAVRFVPSARPTSNGQQRTPKPSPLAQMPPKSSVSPALSESIHFLRRCGSCGLHNISEEKCLSWEAMDFCNEECLTRYQNVHGSHCSFCKKGVQLASMGKYAVRFGLEARQFCSGSCLEDFKKGLKSCSYCQKDITKATYIVKITSSDKQQVKEFCSQGCKSSYECLSANLPLPVIENSCTVCTIKKKVEFHVLVAGKTHPLCSDVCFSAFNFANGIKETDQCNICKKHYEENSPDSYFVFHEDAPFLLCSKVCMNVFILFRRKIVPCSWCKVKKYNFDMIKKTIAASGVVSYVCSINCLALYQVSTSAPISRKIQCESCKTISPAQYHLTMSDASIRNFCSYSCVMTYQGQYGKVDASKPKMSTPVPLGAPRRVFPQSQSTTALIKSMNANDNQRTSIPKSNVANGLLPQITSTSSVLKVASPISLAPAVTTGLSPVITTTSSIQVQTPQTKYVQQLIVMPPKPKEMANKNTQCRPSTATKGVSCKPRTSEAETQTDEHLKYPAIVPIPVPIYVPVPLHMFNMPFPVPVPFPLPIPVPIFIPTTQKTFKGLTTKIKSILDKTPSNPYEAEVLLMAKMIANEDRPTDGNNDMEDDSSHFCDAAPDISDGEAPLDDTPPTTSNFNEDVLQMLQMASDQLNNPPSVDLEAELTSNTITAQPQGKVEETSTPPEEPEPVLERPRTRKRTQRATAQSVAEAPPRKRGRQSQQQQQSPQTSSISEGENSTPSNSASSVSLKLTESVTTPSIPEKDRPDASMCLKYTIGVRGWKQWVMQKNEQLEQAAAASNSKKAKTFNVNILKLTTDELNYLLCKFVAEVRKPNGTEYAPDTIYYLCLSIQQYLFENGRIDNIFTDTMYEPFTDALDEVAKRFSEVNDSTQFILTRVEEEHLWESKQLGAHSPHVLLATLMFFNTKYFNLATLEEHMQLSFSHILKHWKRNPAAGVPSDAPNSRKKKVYEQHENEVNPLRCPVKLYEFYLSKCPESVKQRNDVFYLQPERSCVPDSPVWYSTMPLQKDLLMKMLHRIRMVKEVNISLLAS